MPQYLIKAGESFRDSDGSIKTGGQHIELDEQMAAIHRDKLEQPQAAEAPAQARGDQAAAQ